MVLVVVSTYIAWTVTLFSWDVDITQRVQGFDLGPAHFLRNMLFWMGVRGVAGAAMVVVFGVLWMQRRRLDAIFLALISIPDIFNIWLKEIIGRPRPSADMVEVMGGPQGFSFPSGHALHVVLFYGFLLYLGSRYIPSRRLMWALWTAGALYVLFSGLWLIYDGRHWLTDVLGGYIYGAFYLLALIAAHNWAGRRMRRNEHRRLPRILPPLVRRPAERVLRMIS